MRIAVGGICHDRETIPRWVEGLHALDTEGLEIVRAYVADGVRPGGWERVLHYPRALTVVEDMPYPLYRRKGGSAEERQRIFERLAILRNKLAELAVQLDCDALFSVDSDIVPPPETLQRLVAADQPWVGALVRNNATMRDAWNVYEVRHIDQGGLVHRFLATGKRASGQVWPGPEGAGRDPRGRKAYPLAAGAVCLYRRDLLEKARWSSPERGSGEDTGFALAAFAAGYSAWYLPIICRHLTIRGEGVAGYAN